MKRIHSLTITITTIALLTFSNHTAATYATFKNNNNTIELKTSNLSYILPYLGTYIVPDELKTGQEIKRSVHGILQIPELSIVHVRRVNMHGRMAKEITFDILKTIEQHTKNSLLLSKNPGAAPLQPFFTISYTIDLNNNNNSPLFIMRLSKEYLPGLDPRQGWGPAWLTIKEFKDAWEFQLQAKQVTLEQPKLAAPASGSIE